MRTWPALSLVTLTVFTGCADKARQAAADDAKRVAAQQAAYDSGEDQLRSELATGKAAVWAAGDESFPTLDATTGLPIVVIATGSVDRATARRVEGHNEALKRYIDENGLPPGSRRQWLDLVNHPQAMFAKQAKEQDAASLADGTAPVRSSDGVFTLVVRDLPGSRPGSSAAQELILYNAHGQTAVPALKSVTHYAGGKVAWGPASSDTAVFSLPAEKEERFAVLDLRSGLWLSQH